MIEEIEGKTLKKRSILKQNNNAITEKGLL